MELVCLQLRPLPVLQLVLQTLLAIKENAYLLSHLQVHSSAAQTQTVKPAISAKEECVSQTLQLWSLALIVQLVHQQKSVNMGHVFQLHQLVFQLVQLILLVITVNVFQLYLLRVLSNAVLIRIVRLEIFVKEEFVSLILQIDVSRVVYQANNVLMVFVCLHLRLLRHVFLLVQGILHVKVDNVCQ